MTRGRIVAKCSSDPQVDYPEVKIHIRDLVLPSLPSEGSVFGENSFYRAPGGKLAQETCAGCTYQRYTTGEQGRIQGRDRVDIVEGPVGTGPAGKFVLLRNPGTRRGDRHVAKRKSDPRVAYPEVKV